jgi:hypothetical protein
MKRKIDYTPVVEARRKYRAAREERASSLWRSLAAEYRRVHGLSETTPIGAADESLLRSAVSASLEIHITTDRLVAGHANQKSLKSVGLARSELRRCLRSLGMIGDSGEPPADPNAPPPGAPTDESMAEVVASFGGTPQGGR